MFENTLTEKARASIKPLIDSKEIRSMDLETSFQVHSGEMIREKYRGVFSQIETRLNIALHPYFL